MIFQREAEVKHFNAWDQNYGQVSLAGTTEKNAYAKAAALRKFRKFILYKCHDSSL